MFWTYYLGVFFRPGRTLRALAADPRRIKFGAWALLIMAGVYQLVYIFLAAAGGRPAALKPWLAIDPEVYYRFNAIWIVPSMFMSWIVAAGVVHLLARLAKRPGSFDDLLALFGFGIGTASWATGIFDLVTSFLGAVGIMNQRALEDAMNDVTSFQGIFLWFRMLLYLVWFVVFFSLAIRAERRTGPRASAVFGLAGFAVYQAVFFLFNR